MRRALVLLLLAGCSSGSVPAALPSPTTTAAPVGVVVAVVTGDALGLYRIGTDRRAVLVRTLQAPSGTEKPGNLSVRGPDVCAVWAGDVDGGSPELVTLRCYPAGDAQGVDVPVVGRPFAVALGPDAVSWVATSNPDVTAPTDDQELSTARYAAGAVSEVDTRPVGDLDLGCGDLLSDLAYAGDRLLVQCNGVDDDPGPLQVLGTPESIEDDAPPYTFLTEVKSADATTALGLQGEYCEITCADRQPPEHKRAVRFSLATGKVVEVVATPAKDRFVSSVSGGASGVVYLTRGADPQDVRVYLRLPGESKGVQVSGLPAAVRDVVASS